MINWVYDLAADRKIECHNQSEECNLGISYYFFITVCTYSFCFSMCNINKNRLRLYCFFLADFINNNYFGSIEDPSHRETCPRRPFLLCQMLLATLSCRNRCGLVADVVSSLRVVRLYLDCVRGTQPRYHRRKKPDDTIDAIYRSLS